MKYSTALSPSDEATPAPTLLANWMDGYAIVEVGDRWWARARWRDTHKLWFCESYEPGRGPVNAEHLHSEQDARAWCEEQAGTEAPPQPLPSHPEVLDGSHLGRHGLKKKLGKLIAALAEYSVTVHRDHSRKPIVEGPGFYVCRVVPAKGVKPGAIEKAKDAVKLRLGLEADQNIRAYVDRGAVVLEIPKLDHERYIVDAERLWARTDWPADELYAPIGEDVTGDIVGLSFSSASSPHLLLGGTTGSGKSVALETILLGLARSREPSELTLRLVDPKGTELVALEALSHVAGRSGIDAYDTKQILETAIAEMQDRYRLFRSARVRSLSEYNRRTRASLPWEVIVLDEYADLTADHEDRKALEPLVQRLAQKARAAGIHLIVCTQKPSAKVLSTTIRSNLPAQLALRVKTWQDSQVILDCNGAEALAGKGDALLNTAAGLVRLQCAIHRGGA